MKLLKIGMCLLSIFLTPSVVLAQPNMKLKIGFMLPYSGTFAALGNAIENGFTLYIKENGGKLAGREIVTSKWMMSLTRLRQLIMSINSLSETMWMSLLVQSTLGLQWRWPKLPKIPAQL